MFEGRFFLGVGAGEALNEHVMGQYWPPVEIRHEMLTEALVVMRELWKGETVDFHGAYFTVENARLYDVPDAPIPVVVSAFGPKAAEVAAKQGDGIWMTGPRDDVLDAFEKAKGTGPRIGQLTVCWARDRSRGSRDRVGALAQHGAAGPARPGPPDSVTLRAGRAARALRRTSLRRCRAGLTPGRSSRSSTTSSPRASTTSTSIRSALIRTGFFEFWEHEVQPKL